MKNKIKPKNMKFTVEVTVKPSPVFNFKCQTDFEREYEDIFIRSIEEAMRKGNVSKMKVKRNK